MFADSSLFNTSASSAANPASAPAPASDLSAESALFHTLFDMSAPINTINQDFCLFDVDESCFDYPLFNGANAAKTLKTAQANGASLDFFNNQLCTPNTPSLDLVSAASIAQAEGLGFDSCSAFLEDASRAHHLLDTPFTPYLDTPMLLDTPLETPLVTPFMDDFALDNEVDAKNAGGAFPLFSDFGINFTFGNAYTIEPAMLLPPQEFDFRAPNDAALSSPLMSAFSSVPVSPAKSIQSDFSETCESEDDDEYVDSRSAALVSAFKRKAQVASVSPSKKMRPIDGLEAADIKRHSAPKRFSCNHDGCDRQFARLFNLHTHEKTHDPEQARPFLCSDAACGKAFSRKHDLQRHEASVHKGERNFACTKCHRPFSRQDGLRRHLSVKGPCFENGWLAT
ncbi:hypothetical protein BGZ58_007718 [Dissophora ornata]|nr:hypothetical protein BGZ58_007718 [Dissophora ornata]